MGYVATPTNSQLLTLPASTLTGLQKQRRFLLRIALTPMPCPICHEPTNKLEAAGVELDAYDVTGAKDAHQYRCPHCQAPLTYVVPFMPGPTYVWQHKVEKK